MLSTLPKLADRSFIYGFYLPTLLFSVVALILFQDCPAAEGMLSDLAAKEITKAAYVLLMVWVMAIALLTLNHPLYRFLEGYTFPDWLAEPLRARNRDGLQKALDEIRTLFQRRRLEGKQFPSVDLRRYRILRRDTANSMPSTSPDVLPTAFGNAIRAFELYSRDIYGVDGVWVWLRLATVIPKDVVEQIQDSRTPIDFLINCCLYSFAIAALAFGRVIYAGFQQQPIATTPVGSWLAFGADGLLAAYLFYRWAVTRVPAWGNWVMSAYDCYLPALAKQLGYELPPTEAERIAFWNAFSRQLIYRRDPDGKLAFSVEKWVKPAADAEKTKTPQTVALTINVENDGH
jgi:hypothetical protein